MTKVIPFAPTIRESKPHENVQLIADLVISGDLKGAQIALNLVVEAAVKRAKKLELKK